MKPLLTKRLIKLLAFICFMLLSLLIKESINAKEKLKLNVGHNEAITSIAFSPNGKLIVSESWDNTVKLWDVNSGKLLVTIYPMTWSNKKWKVTRTEYITVTPDNYYVMSKKGSENLHWVKGLEVIGFQQFDLKYNRPDIVMERLGSTDKRN